jgi:hypothetical protein
VDGRIDGPSGSRSSVALVDGSDCRRVRLKQVVYYTLYICTTEKSGNCLRPMAVAESLNSTESPTLGDWSEELSSAEFPRFKYVS